VRPVCNRWPILPASPRRFSSGSYEASNVPVLTVNIIPYWGTGNGKLGTGGWGNVPMEYQKRALARHFRAHTRARTDVAAPTIATARDASPPRAPLPHPFRPSIRLFPDGPGTYSPDSPHPLPPRHILQYVTGGKTIRRVVPFGGLRTCAGAQPTLRRASMRSPPADFLRMLLMWTQIARSSA